MRNRESMITKIKTIDDKEYYILGDKDNTLQKINDQIKKGSKFVMLTEVLFSGYVDVDATLEEKYFNIDNITNFWDVSVPTDSIRKSFEYM